jgi:hypothetical protein
MIVTGTKYSVNLVKKKMVSEVKIRQVLDVLTTAPKFEIESLKTDSKRHAKNMKTLIEQSNIVGVGISEKETLNENVGKLALTFYVKKKIPLKKLHADKVIPPTVPESLSAIAIPTDVKVIGDLRPEVNFTRNPIQPGYSTAHKNTNAGTLGAIVTDGTDYYILSNSHVLAKSGKAKKGDPILYPSKADGGKHPKDIIAHLSEFVPFKKGLEYTNLVDCAIAKILPEKLKDVLTNIKITGRKMPSGKIKPKRGMKVIKVGRTTDKTEGEIRDIDFRAAIPYEEKGVGEIRFVKQVLCTRFTRGGDSGSLVVDKKSGKAVGLHFCGSAMGSAFNPIDNVLKALNVKLVTKKKI